MRYSDYFTNGSNLGGASEESDVFAVTCPTCDHVQDQDECFLGRLGYLAHYRCRYCGMGFSIAPGKDS